MRLALPPTVTVPMVVAALALTGTSSAAAPTEQTVSYLGLNFSVPADWPLINLAENPAACVRFDRHAVYLGTPGAQQDCPSAAVGHTEALLVQPSTSNSASSTDNPTAQQISATAAGASITATYASDQGLAERILASAGLPKATESDQQPQPQNAPKPGLSWPSSTLSNGAGEGFDACAAPSTAAMSAWRGAYSNIGVYLGGEDRACAQPNLTPAWVSAQAAAGWKFIPIYVGPQAAFGELTSPVNQGIAAANDAIIQALKLGFLPGNVLYYDMESYPAADGPAALAFEAAWSGELHTFGYWSGVYSSEKTGIADLVANYGGLTTPDVAWIARWNSQDSTDTPLEPKTMWANHQRLHQYVGGVDETHGGVKINIDKDVLDVAQAGPPAQPVRTRFVSTTATQLLSDAALSAGETQGELVTGTPVAPISATAVTLRVTATGTGNLVAYQDGVPQPTIPNLNFINGVLRTERVTVAVTDGRIDFAALQGDVTLNVSVIGYFTR
jgi:glycoside hydrolase-like protein